MTVVVPDHPPEGTAAHRHDQARAALQAAELRTGVRRGGRPRRGAAVVPLQVQRQVDVIGADVAGPDVAGESHRLHPVHPDLAALLPDGGLREGSTVVVRNSTTLLLALLTEASKAGAWVALVGHPAAGLAAAGWGLDLDRTVSVPAPGPDAPAVVAALLDGLDLVVVGPRTPLLESDRRRLSARARERGSVLIAVDEPGAAGMAGAARPASPRPGDRAPETGVRGARSPDRGAHVVLDVRGGSWSGSDHGAGWLRRRSLTVHRTGRGAAARPVDLEVVVPLRVEVVVPGTRVGRVAHVAAHAAPVRLHAVPDVAPTVGDPDERLAG
ncbi:hypothetical protein [Antribacter gilvus]|uniref:hypothetical protein n=1 Tax=Antribacter gilvus TaxID=2304675 RepID=UPI000F783BDD|nr:hypothetical protein [Antribacter gilvus]